MASTTSLFTGLSGLLANSRRLDVIGNNIANANTTAYKSNRLMFASAFSRTYSGGSPPGESSGGTNPSQVGLGVNIAGTQRDFSGGSITATGDPRDLAIEGKGFFVVNRGSQQLYTRAGSFRQDSANNLVSIFGDRVQGYGVDANYNIVPGALQDVNIPVGIMRLAEATRNVEFTGNLNASGDAATRGAAFELGGENGDGFSLIPTATNPAPPGSMIVGGSFLTEISDPAAPASPLFTAGQTIEVREAERGDRTIPTQTFTIGATTTVQELTDFLTDALGINTGAGPNPDGGIPGVAIDAVNGRLTITGNTGTINDIDLDSADIRLLDSAGEYLRAPFEAEKSGDADGESVRTTFIVYDSLGSPVSVDVGMTLESRGNGGSVWRYYVDSFDDSDMSPAVATGALNFDTSGQLESSPELSITLDRDGTGAESPLAVTLNLSGAGGAVTALASDQSGIAAVFQDGAPLGTLSNFGIANDGTIIGSFTNGLTRVLGQVAIATFANQEGLIDDGANLFRISGASGPAVITSAGELGTGQMVGGALELSNVDLGQEFINMILTSTGYSASSRVIRTTDELLQQLLVIGR